MKHTKEFLKAQEDYLKAYQDCFTEFTFGRSYSSSFDAFQCRYSSALKHMQSFKEEYAQVLAEQAKENKPANPFFS